MAENNSVSRIIRQAATDVSQPKGRKIGRLDQGKKQVFQGVERFMACAELQAVEVMMCPPCFKARRGTCSIDGSKAGQRPRLRA